MKHFLLILVSFISLSFNSQNSKGTDNEKNWIINWTNFKSKITDYNTATEILSGNISETKFLKRDKVYLLMGNVYVTNNVTLFIEPGTLIRGDFETNGTLIITRGSKIIAIGDETSPIVFTSNKPAQERKSGDWGGVIVMGNAPVNKFTGTLDLKLDAKYNSYGGLDANDDSGILKYVRIEFPGKKGVHSRFLNGLLLAGVGKNTIINHVAVSFSKGDSFEFNGGDVMANNIVSYRPSDDDFDFTEGTQVILENGIAIRNPYATNSENPRVFEINSCDDIANSDLSKKATNVKFFKFTAIRENENEKGFTDAISYIDDLCQVQMEGCVFSGFETGNIFSKKIDYNKSDKYKHQFKNIIYNNCDNIFISEERESTILINDFFDSLENGIEKKSISSIELFVSIDFKKVPDLRIKQPQTLVSIK